MEINSLASYALNFYKNQEGTSYSAQEISDSLERICDMAGGLDRKNDLPLNFGDSDFTQEEFVSQMQATFGYQGEDAEKDFAILFGILNTDSSDGKLNSEEISAFMGEESLSQAALWKNLYGCDEDIQDVLLHFEKIKNSSGDDTTTSTESTTPTLPDAEPGKNVTLTQKEIDKYAARLFNAMDGAGTDEATVNSILNNPNITPDDWVEIVATYEQKYGSMAGGKSLVHKINDDFSGKAQDQLEIKLAQKLVEAAEAGSEKAVNLIASELYHATAGMNGTCDEFLEGFFDSVSDETLKKIDNAYSSVNGGSDLVSDIKKDKSWWNDGGWATVVGGVSAGLGGGIGIIAGLVAGITGGISGAKSSNEAKSWIERLNSL